VWDPCSKGFGLKPKSPNPNSMHMEGEEGDPDPRDKILDHHQTMDKRGLNPANKNTSQLVIKGASTITREKEEVRQ
jgi:hypothetical protein